ncbi:DUF3108 domain-containing protein [Celerinatantimonas sp. YJH-8]|uniref:DUF3108 domain-containing protein n=1 Tax=Celerinatantimonas sp. YJH-8 TaxID=3228714 RepID=UPI0038C59BDA
MTRFRKLAILSCCAFISNVTLAAQSSWQPIQPFEAHYDAYFKGISVGSGLRILKRTAANTYQASSQAKVLGGAGMSYDETSQFRYDGEHIISEGFKRTKKVLLGSQKIVGHPDRNGGLFVSGDDKRQHVESGAWGNTLDSSAFMVQFQTDVKNGKTTFHYHYVEGDEIKDYQFKIDGQETITVPAGTYQTIRLKRINKGSRETFMWLAPKLDYQLVKMQVLRDGKRWSSMALTQLKLDQPSTATSSTNE